MKGVSIIIPAYNEEANIEDCLDSIYSMDYPLFEVIVSDGMSSDKTRDIIKTKYPYVKLLDNHKKYTSHARNLGISKAKYPYVAFTDADCKVPFNWLRVLMNEFEKLEDDVAGVGGANYAPDDSPEFVKAIASAQKTFIGNLGSVQGKVFEKKQEVDSIATCNSIYRKKALLSVGGFSEEHKDLAEDWELNYRLRKKGYKLMVIPGSYVWHKFRASPGKFFSNMYRYGMGRAILMKKYPKAIRPIYVVPLGFLLGMVIFPPLFIPYAVVLALLARSLDKKMWFDITLVFILQHFGYALGEWFGLIFNDRVRL